MSRYQLYVFDLDGTLYRGDEAIPYAAQTVQKIKASGAAIAYVTNNATETPAFFTEKLNRLGFAASTDQVFTSATAAADYCGSKPDARIGVFGESGLISLLAEKSTYVFGPDEVWPDPLDFVVAGLFRQCSYQHIAAAMKAIRAGAAFIATNRDTTFPLEEGVLAPGAGAAIAAIAACSGVKPIVMGKPNPRLIEMAMRAFGASPQQTLVVGDRFDTDIASGLAAGAQVWMVLTGVDSAAPSGIPFSQDLRDLPNC